MEKQHKKTFFFFYVVFFITHLVAFGIWWGRVANTQGDFFRYIPIILFSGLRIGFLSAIAYRVIATFLKGIANLKDPFGVSYLFAALFGISDAIITLTLGYSCYYISELFDMSIGIGLAFFAVSFIVTWIVSAFLSTYLFVRVAETFRKKWAVGDVISIKQIKLGMDFWLPF